MFELHSKYVDLMNNLLSFNKSVLVASSFKSEEISSKVSQSTFSNDDGLKSCIEVLLKDSISILCFKPTSLAEADDLKFEKLTLSLKKVQKYFLKLTSFLTKLHEANPDVLESFKNSLQFLTSLVYLVSCDVNKEWYNCDLADGVENVIKTFNLAESKDELLEKCFKKVFRHSIKNLKTDQWKLHQVDMTILANLIRSSQNEILSENLFNVSPFILKLVDDYNPTYVLQGLGLLKHLFQTLPGAELKMHGLVEVFFDALHKRLFYCDHDVLKELLPVLLLCLKTVQPKLQRLLKKEERLLAEKIFEQILTNITMTSETNKIRLYFEFLEDFYHYMELEMIAHLDKISEFYVKFIEDCNYSLMPALIRSLLVLFKYTWVRIDPLQFLQPAIKTLLLLDRNKNKSEQIDRVYGCLYELVDNLVLIDQSGDVEKIIGKLRVVGNMDFHLEKLNNLKELKQNE